MERFPDRAPPRKLDVQKELDAVIGKYEERPGEKWVVRAMRIIARGLIGSMLAIAVSAAIIYTLHKHVRDAQTAPPPPPDPRKPITIQLVPPPSDTRK